LDWNRPGSSGESWIINQQGLGSGGIRFGKSDLSNNVALWGGFDEQSLGGNFYVVNTSNGTDRIRTKWDPSVALGDAACCLDMQTPGNFAQLHLSAAAVNISSQNNPFGKDGFCESGQFSANESYISGGGFFGKIVDVVPDPFLSTGDYCPVGTVSSTFMGFDFVSYFPGNLLGLSPGQSGVAFYECTTPGAGKALKFVIYQNNGTNGVGGMYNP
jgi:hypothetical protein